MKGKAILLMLFGISLVSLLAGQNENLYELGGITVKGAHFSDEKAVIALSGLQVGDKLEIPGAQIGQAIKALWKQELFNDVKIYVARKVGTVAFLEIEVEEAIRFSSYSIKGIRKKEQEKLKEHINKHIRPGERWNLNKANIIKQSLYGYFQEAGYAFAEINIEEQLIGQRNELKLLIQIDKGAKQKIHRIHFVGNNKVSGHKLRKQMSLGGKFWKKARFVAQALETDKATLRGYYHTLGYKDVAVDKDSLWKDEKGRLHLSIHVEEGEAYYINSIQWIGNSVYPTDLLQKLLQINAGDVYNQQLLEQRLFFDEQGRDISSLYMDNGYLFLKIEPVERGIEHNKIDLEIRITEGPLATIGSVEIKGNTRTNEAVIRRELITTPGQAFNRAAVIASQRRLMALGYFNPETLDIATEVDPESKTVALIYEVEEKRNEQLELSAGWNPTSNQIVGTLGLNLNNFSLKNLTHPDRWNPLPSGDGQTLSLRLQSTGAEYQAANFTFSEPWMGGKRPNLFTVAGFYQRFTNGESVSSDDFEGLSVIGGSVQLGTRFRLWRQTFAFTTELSAQHIELNRYRDILLDDGSTINTGHFNNLYVKPKLAYSNIGDPFFPRQGLQASLSAQFTPPYSLFNGGQAGASYKWLEYHKWRFDMAHYISLSKRLVVKTGLKMGWLSSYNNEAGTPPFERFELGGNGISSTQAGFVGNDILSLRGYGENEFAANTNGGGASFLKTNIELRYELFNQPAVRAYILGFAEAGNVWKKDHQFSPFDLRPSVGAGIRLQVPMFGTLGFDYGLGLDKPELEGQHWSKYGTFNIILGIEPE